MNNEQKAELVFKEELEAIKSDDIRKFVRGCFLKFTPDYFWEVAASSTGRHHPKISNKIHGLILHVKLSIWWGRKIAETFCKYDMDIIIAGLLLHDLQKFGTIMNDGKSTLPNYTSTHGLLMASQIVDHMEVKGISICGNRYGEIAACVALHMGKWTDEMLSDKWRKDYGDRNNVKIVQLADYMASRKVGEKLKELDNLTFKVLDE